MSLAPAHARGPAPGPAATAAAVPSGAAGRRPPSIGRTYGASAEGQRTGATAANAGRALIASAGSSGQSSRAPSLGRPSPPTTEDLSQDAQRAQLAEPRGAAPLDSLQELLEGRGRPASGGRAVRPAQARPSLRGQERLPSGQGVDFDDEARKLWARLNLDPSLVNQGPFNALDPLWQHPETRGVFYVGNQTAAASLELLQKHNITHVVNCTDNMPLYHQRKGGGGPIKYYRFDITSHYRRVRTEQDAVAFVQPMLDFVTAALAEGKNVMVHCLAGAHRAGTTGIICLMHFLGVPPWQTARDMAKKCRPIIDPISEFPTLLAKLERGWKAAKQEG